MKDIEYNKGFVNIYTKNIDLENVEWEKFGTFTLVTIFDDSNKFQIYPANVLGEMSSSSELTLYDTREDGKEYYSNGLLSNGFTPKTVIGTCRIGGFSRLCEIVDLILARK